MKRLIAITLSLLVLAALQDAATPSSGPSAAHPASAQSGVPHVGKAPGGTSGSDGQPPSLPLPHAPRTISGTATWYCLSGSSACTRGYGQSDLVAAIDPTTGIEKGERVTVWHGDRSVTVTIRDVCACAGRRIIDLTSGAFRRLAPLSRGVIAVTLDVGGPTPTLPATDTEGTR